MRVLRDSTFAVSGLRVGCAIVFVVHDDVVPVRRRLSADGRLSSKCYGCVAATLRFGDFVELAYCHVQYCRREVFLKGALRLAVFLVAAGCLYDLPWHLGVLSFRNGFYLVAVFVDRYGGDLSRDSDERTGALVLAVLPHLVSTDCDSCFLVEELYQGLTLNSLRVRTNALNNVCSGTVTLSARLFTYIGVAGSFVLYRLGAVVVTAPCRRRDSRDRYRGMGLYFRGLLFL